MIPAPRRPAPVRAGRAAALTLLLVLLAVAGAPETARGDARASCIARPAEPVVEWTLVDPVAFGAKAAVDAGLPAATRTPRPAVEAQPVPGAPSSMFVRAWLPITVGEFSLLCITAMLPRSFTGWSADFVGEGAGHFAEAWTRPPVWDRDHWFHNYVGHPYGGNFYYNSVRSRGATPGQSFVFTAVLSAQWEYVFEAVAERPSIQDLIVTPIAGAALGELTHRMSNRMRRGRVTLPEKIAMTLLNPADVLTHGYKSMP